MTKPPRRNEAEYFAHREAELLRQQRESAQHAAADAERHSHRMKCPRCGYDLVTGEWRGVEIGQCTHCHGLWLDADQAKRILAHPPGTFTGIFGTLLRGVTGAKVDE